MKIVKTAEARAFYRQAVERLPKEEYERERSRAIPWEVSLSALSSFFFETGKRLGWMEEGTAEAKRAPIILGVSGGSDSMAMLWLFRTFCPRPLIVGHLEHGMRGEISLEDARYVERMAAQWGIESRVLHVDVPGSLRKGESLESGGRRIRRDFLGALARERRAFGVALAHNREDVAETVLFNLLRGTGARGAVGIPERSGIFFRPLLTRSREFLRSILRFRNIEWREDSTNRDNRFTRNFIRNELMPLIAARVNERAVDHLVAFGEEMRYYREEEERRATFLLKTTRTPAGQNALWTMDRAEAASLSLHERVFLIRETGRYLGLHALSRKRGMELARLLQGRKSFEFQWGDGVSVWGDGESVNWRRPDDTKGEKGSG